MKILSEKLKNDSSRDVYWSRIIIESDERDKHVKVLVCASYEYLRDEFTKSEFTEKQMQLWLDGFIDNYLKPKGDSLFNKEVDYYPFATNEEGRLNILSFLKKI